MRARVERLLADGHAVRLPPADAALVVQQLRLALAARCRRQPRRAQDKPMRGQITGEYPGMAARRVADDDLARRPRQRRQQCRQGQRRPALVQHVAADDQVEAAHACAARGPVHAPVRHRGQIVQGSVVGQEHFGQRMVVAGHHLRTAPAQHQAGQAQAATQFQHALASHFVDLHGICEHQPGRPDVAEQAPLGR